ncbi:MAG: Do family serine endopeptidase [Spirochaetales bacterium]|nr:Do family serine endopeptidase [Spirochaetales bacterium]
MFTERKISKKLIIILTVLLTFTVSGSLFAQRTGSVGSASGSTAGLAETYQMTFREVAASTLPVVVEVNVVNIVETQSFPDAFEFFFGNNPNQREQESKPREFRQQGLGSGVIVQTESDNVYILTNHHVVNGADEIKITLTDGREYEATLVGSDPRLDLALVVIKTKENIPVAVLGDSDDLFVGDWVFAVGNPMGFASTFTAGVVSAVGRETANFSNNISFTDYIQTDAAINPGNSGGALVNIRGEVIGINSWIATQSGGSNGLGFSIPINNAKNAIADFIKSGSVEYGWLGVNVRDISDESKVAMKLEGVDGAFINDVFIASPADNGGLMAGDYITKVGTKVVKNRNDLVKVIGNLSPDLWTAFELYRDGEKQTVSLKLGRRDDKKNIAEDGSIDVWPGMTVVEATDEVRESLNLETNKGNVIVANVVKGSPAEASGLRPGDIVLRVDNKRIKSMGDFYMRLNSSESNEVMIRIYRGTREAIIGIVKE